MSDPDPKYTWGAIPSFAALLGDTPNLKSFFQKALDHLSQGVRSYEGRVKPRDFIAKLKSFEDTLGLARFLDIAVVQAAVKALDFYFADQIPNLRSGSDFNAAVITASEMARHLSKEGANLFEEFWRIYGQARELSYRELEVRAESR